MSSLETATARVAHAASDLVYAIEWNRNGDSAYCATLLELQKQGVQNAFGNQPEVLKAYENADPFAALHAPLSKGALVSVICAARTLLPAIPHLYKMASAKTAVVFHVAANRSAAYGLGDYTDVMTIRQTGCALLFSSGLQEASDMALIAHTIAIKTSRPVVHVFDASRTEQTSPMKFSAVGNDLIANLLETGDIEKYRESVKKADASELYFKPANGSKSDEQNVDFFSTADQVFNTFRQSTGRTYNIGEYWGEKKSEHIIITLGSGADLLQRSLEKHPDSRVSLFKIRLYRPWSEKHILAAIPSEVKKVAVVEQIAKRTTKWTPLYLDIVASFENRTYWTKESPTVSCGQYGSVNESTIDAAVKRVIDDLAASEPPKEFVLGTVHALNGTSSANGVMVKTPTLEQAYLKMLEEVFKDRLFIANALSSETVGHLGAVKSMPEFGFGVLLTRLQERSQFAELVEKAVRDGSISMSEGLHSTLSEWLVHKDDGELSDKHGKAAVDALTSEYTKHTLLRKIYEQRSLFPKPANWLVGSDVWSYDIGNSGVHHVIASGKDINILVIDSQPYTTRTSQDSEKRKKDIGLYAMNYGEAFVASVAVYSSYTQVLHALMEAERYSGPSVVLAYLPYHNVSDSTVTVLKETKLAVDTGYWPLYRWNPALEKEGKEPFTLDSEQIKQELRAFLDRENHLTQLVRARPELAATLTSSLESEVATRQKSLAKSAYDKLLGGLTGPPLLILFGSDNGNAEGLARQLEKGGKARGVNARCIAMDEFPIEDIASEKNIVFVTSTAGQGEFPQNARDFWKTISSTTDISFSEIKYSVFSLGDSLYWPRKEDYIYYNKPGKDLDARLELLGGQRLVPLGLGDDQDPDGFETGFQAWEPQLWDALGVKLLGTVIEIPKKTDDDMKTESNFLRGTIVEGLEDTSTGALCERDTKLTKFHGIYQQDDRDLRDERKAQGLEKAFMFMVRVRVPGGVSTSQQWIAMDKIADDHANGSLKLTTRQAFQLHGVLKRNLKSTIRDINKVLLDTLAACGDVNRNVMCNPNPYLSEVHGQVQEFARDLSAHLSPRTTAYHEIWLEDKVVAGHAVQDFEPLYGSTYLPRKFKIAIAIPPNNDVDVFAHDLGYIAITNRNGELVGYNVTVGGGMGMTHNNKKTYPQVASLLGFCPPEQAIDVGEKVMLVQRDYGDRTNRKHARLKYTIDDRSLEWFRSEVESRLGYKLQEPQEFKFENNADRYGWTKGINDSWHFCMYIENGRVKDLPGAPIKTGLREIAKVHKGDFRLTPNQHLIVGNVAQKDKSQIDALLKQYGLDNLQYTGLRLNSMACVALPTCGLAMAESERYLPSLVSKLETVIEEAGLRDDAITIRMTGCPNGCARPYVAEIAFVGKSVGAYNVYLGGGHSGQRLNKLFRESIKEDEILRELKPILHRYAKERRDNEKFGDWVIRAGYVKETHNGKDFHEL